MHSFRVSTFKGVICGTYACITCTSFLAKKLLAQVTFRRYFQMCHRLNDSCLFSICCGICSLQRAVSGAIHNQSAALLHLHILYQARCYLLYQPCGKRYIRADTGRSYDKTSYQ